MNSKIKASGWRTELFFFAGLGLQPWQTALADEGVGVKAWGLWMTSLPAWIPVFFFVIVFACLSLLALSIYRRRHQLKAHNLFATASATLGGAVLGVLLAFLSMDALY
ncbi:MAG: hypothetical protein ACXV7F_04320, partial [Methylomonas sp.]